MLVGDDSRPHAPDVGGSGFGALRQAPGHYLARRQRPEQRPARVQGSATVCILVLEGARLHAANLGDSGFWVLRGRKVVHRSPPQQHAFNWPFQLGSPGSRSDTPSSADVRCRFVWARPSSGAAVHVHAKPPVPCQYDQEFGYCMISKKHAAAAQQL